MLPNFTLYKMYQLIIVYNLTFSSSIYIRLTLNELLDDFSVTYLLILSQGCLQADTNHSNMNTSRRAHNFLLLHIPIQRSLSNMSEIFNKY